MLGIFQIWGSFFDKLVTRESNLQNRWKKCLFIIWKPMHLFMTSIKSLTLLVRLLLLSLLPSRVYASMESSNSDQLKSLFRWLIWTQKYLKASCCSFLVLIFCLYLLLKIWIKFQFKRNCPCELIYSTMQVSLILIEENRQMIFLICTEIPRNMEYIILAALMRPYPHFINCQILSVCLKWWLSFSQN